jgi:hypothetical protein
LLYKLDETTKRLEMRTSENFRQLRTELFSQMTSLGEEIATVSDALQEDGGVPDDTDPN